MSFSRAWLSGYQPIARACISTPRLRKARVPSLTSRQCIGQQHLTSGFTRDQRLVASYSSFPNHILAASGGNLAEQVKEKNQKHPVIVYSKSWCPYCAQVKGLFQELKVDFTAVELDEVVEGEQVQDALLSITKSRTVPQVFIKGEFIGGCDDTLRAYSSGQLAEKLSAAGVEANL